MFVNDPPNAGCSAAITVCSNDQAFALVDVLTFPLPERYLDRSGVVRNGVFIPGTARPARTPTVPGQLLRERHGNGDGFGEHGRQRWLQWQCHALQHVRFVQPVLGAHLYAPNRHLDGTRQAPFRTFVPATEPQGVYTYVVAGQAPARTIRPPSRSR